MSTYPFAAIVGQDEMRLALVLNAIAPKIGGVLLMGHRGTGKSTAVRALAELLPPRKRGTFYIELNTGEGYRQIPFKLGEEGARIPIVDLPLSATEDRVVGTLDIEAALTRGERSFEPGLLAKAHGGFLYIDEVNLLEDHLVDLLLDVAVMGVNIVEREGLSVRHPARFVLVGSGNPEEGDLRPQLLDRFGLFVEVRTLEDLAQRMEIVKRAEAFRMDPAGFIRQWEPQQERLRQRIARAMEVFSEVELPENLLAKIVELCLVLKIDGHRGELVMHTASRALAAFENRREVHASDVARVAPMALRHRLRKNPLDDIDTGERIQSALRELFPGDIVDQPLSAVFEMDK